MSTCLEHCVHCFVMLIMGHIVHAGRTVAVAMVMRIELDILVHGNAVSGYTGGRTSEFLYLIHMYGSLKKQEFFITNVPNR